MFSPFSRGYYVGRVRVAPRDGERAVWQRAVHERVKGRLHAEEDLVRLDEPLVMKLENRHFAVHGAEDVPDGTLEIPGHLLEDAAVRNPPTRREVLLAKADVARQLLGLSGQLDGDVGV